MYVSNVNSNMCLEKSNQIKSEDQYMQHILQINNSCPNKETRVWYFCINIRSLFCVKMNICHKI